MPRLLTERCLMRLWRITAVRCFNWQLNFKFKFPLNNETQKFKSPNDSALNEILDGDFLGLKTNLPVFSWLNNANFKSSNAKK